MGNHDEAEPWLPGMEPQGLERRKSAPKRNQIKTRTAKDLVPLEMQLVPGGEKIMVYATVEEPKNRRGVRRRRRG